MTEGDLDSIWTPFYRLDKVRDRDGHGLGLSIVRGILENHKSKFGVYFSEEKIVNFWFELAKKTDDIKDVYDVEELEVEEL